MTAEDRREIWLKAKIAGNKILDLIRSREMEGFEYENAICYFNCPYPCCELLRG